MRSKIELLSVYWPKSGLLSRMRGTALLSTALTSYVAFQKFQWSQLLIQSLKFLLNIDQNNRSFKRCSIFYSPIHPADEDTWNIEKISRRRGKGTTMRCIHFWGVSTCSRKTKRSFKILRKWWQKCLIQWWFSVEINQDN